MKYEDENGKNKEQEPRTKNKENRKERIEKRVKTKEY